MKSIHWKKRASFLIMTTFFLTLIADWLFYDEALGWTIGAYVLLVSGCIFLRFKPDERKGAVLALELLVCGLVISLIIEPGLIALILSMFLIISLAVTYRSGWTDDLVLWFEYWREFFRRARTKIFHDTLLLYRPFRNRKCLSVIRTSLIGKWSLPICFGIVFIFFFSMANPVIDKALLGVKQNLQDLILLFLETISLWRAMFWVIVSAGTWAVFRVQVRQKRKSRGILKYAALRRKTIPMGLSSVIRCLIVFNLIFAGQTLLDLTYLFVGVTLPEGLTYAEYAHRGAYPLVATALLAGIFMLSTFRSGGEAERSDLARRWAYLWIAQNIFLMLTAAWRLMLYVEVYRLTRFRVAAAIWMLLVAIGFVCVILRILHQRSNAWLLRTTFVSAVAVLYCCSFINFDGTIAWYNVQHCAEITGKGTAVDLHYLKKLGPESIPALEWLSAKIPSQEAGKRARTIKLNLESRLTKRLSNWRAWSIIRLSLHKTAPEIFSRVRER